MICIPQQTKVTWRNDSEKCTGIAQMTFTYMFEVKSTHVHSTCTPPPPTPTLSLNCSSFPLYTMSNFQVTDPFSETGTKWPQTELAMFKVKTHLHTMWSRYLLVLLCNDWAIWHSGTPLKKCTDPQNDLVPRSKYQYAYYRRKFLSVLLYDELLRVKINLQNFLHVVYTVNTMD